MGSENLPKIKCTVPLPLLVPTITNLWLWIIKLYKVVWKKKEVLKNCPNYVIFLTGFRRGMWIGCSKKSIFLTLYCILQYNELLHKSICYDMIFQNVYFISWLNQLLIWSCKPLIFVGFQKIGIILQELVLKLTLYRILHYNELFTTLFVMILQNLSLFTCVFT